MMNYYNEYEIEDLYEAFDIEEDTLIQMVNPDGTVSIVSARNL